MKKITLGWLRIVLAFMVVDLHYNVFREIFNYLSALTNNAHKFYFCGDGNIAVSGFFVMSGYLVSEILKTKYSSNSRRDFFYFVASRYLRIFPLYLFVLFCFLIILFVYGNRYHSNIITFNVLLLPFGLVDYFANSPIFRHFIILPAWTLSLDLVCYPIGFILWKQRPYLIATVAILAVYYVFVWVHSPASLGTVGYHVNGSWWHEEFYATIEPNMLAFVLGIMANLYLKERKLPPAVLYSAILMLLYVCYFPLFIGYFGAQFIGIVSLTLITAFLAKNGMSKYESMLGSFTYAIYLIHLPMLVVLRSYMDDSKMVTFFLTLAVAFVMAFFIEERFVEFRRRQWLRKWRPTGGELVASFGKANVLVMALLLASISYYYFLFFVR